MSDFNYISPVTILDTFSFYIINKLNKLILRHPFPEETKSVAAHSYSTMAAAFETLRTDRGRMIKVSADILLQSAG